MTLSLSDLIQRVRELDKAATPGPWMAETKWYETGPDHDLVSGPHTPQTQLSRYLSNSFSRQADLELCAESRTLLVQLADAAERMQKEIERMKAIEARAGDIAVWLPNLADTLTTVPVPVIKSNIDRMLRQLQRALGAER